MDPTDPRSHHLMRPDKTIDPNRTMADVIPRTSGRRGVVVRAATNGGVPFKYNPHNMTGAESRLAPRNDGGKPTMLRLDKLDAEDLKVAYEQAAQMVLEEGDDPDKDDAEQMIDRDRRTAGYAMQIAGEMSMQREEYQEPPLGRPAGQSHAVRQAAAAAATPQVQRQGVPATVFRKQAEAAQPRRQNVVSTVMTQPVQPVQQAVQAPPPPPPATDPLFLVHFEWEATGATMEATYFDVIVAGDYIVLLTNLSNNSHRFDPGRSRGPGDVATRIGLWVEGDQSGMIYVVQPTDIRYVTEIAGLQIEHIVLRIEQTVPFQEVMQGG